MLEASGGAEKKGRIAAPFARHGSAEAKVFKRQLLRSLGRDAIARMAAALQCSAGRFDYQPRGIALAVLELVDTLRRANLELPPRWRLASREEILLLQDSTSVADMTPRFAAVLGEGWQARLAAALEMTPHHLARTFRGHDRGLRIVAELLAVLELIEAAADRLPPRWNISTPPPATEAEAVPSDLGRRLYAVLGAGGVDIAAAALGYTPRYLHALLAGARGSVPEAVTAAVELLEALATEAPRKRWPARWRKAGRAANA